MNVQSQNVHLYIQNIYKRGETIYGRLKTIERRRKGRKKKKQKRNENEEKPRIIIINVTSRTYIEGRKRTDIQSVWNEN